LSTSASDEHSECLKFTPGIHFCKLQSAFDVHFQNVFARVVPSPLALHPNF
jgi:hypothetical protein